MTPDPNCFPRRKNRRSLGHRENQSPEPEPFGVSPLPVDDFKTMSHSHQSPKHPERARAKVAGEKACEGAQAQQSPQLSQGRTKVGHLFTGLSNGLSQALDRNNFATPTCPFLGPRQCIQQWQALGADNVLLQGIKKGVHAPLHQVPSPKTPGAAPRRSSKKQ